ncbi:MAG: hypothetical protein ABS43_24550 [Bordetella sp. SCN 67-23]|nr:hypothetical protein [Burkholderiales bacterium]ODS69867.1 MAG: hypothetical protein ABS43_24550 [Bordetella sp. SCN 67-23]ODU72512.1 MAG: hypothetical protein ABT00_17590 [Bordetella sp. SCN 68-11]OJW88200.1 MAG: hypothetical protein BGO71_08660 [Burkholderiales bacterium 67-32]
MPTLTSQKRPRGFAAMDPQKQRAISAEGGRAAHQSGNAHEFNSEEARAAGALSHAHRQRRAAESQVQAQSPSHEEAVQTSPGSS